MIEILFLAFIGFFFVGGLLIAASVENDERSKDG